MPNFTMPNKSSSFCVSPALGSPTLSNPDLILPRLKLTHEYLDTASSFPSKHFSSPNFYLQSSMSLTSSNLSRDTERSTSGDSDAGSPTTGTSESTSSGIVDQLDYKANLLSDFGLKSLVPLKSGRDGVKGLWRRAGIFTGEDVFLENVRDSVYGTEPPKPERIITRGRFGGDDEVNVDSLVSLDTKLSEWSHSGCEHSVSDTSIESEDITDVKLTCNERDLKTNYKFSSSQSLSPMTTPGLPGFWESNLTATPSTLCDLMSNDLSGVTGRYNDCERSSNKSSPKLFKTEICDSPFAKHGFDEEFKSEQNGPDQLSDKADLIIEKVRKQLNYMEGALRDARQSLLSSPIKWESSQYNSWRRGEGVGFSTERRKGSGMDKFGLDSWNSTDNSLGNTTREFRTGRIFTCDSLSHSATRQEWPRLNIDKFTNHLDKESSVKYSDHNLNWNGSVEPRGLDKSGTLNPRGVYELHSVQSPSSQGHGKGETSRKDEFNDGNWWMNQEDMKLSVKKLHERIANLRQRTEEDIKRERLNSRINSHKCGSKENIEKVRNRENIIGQSRSTGFQNNCKSENWNESKAYEQEIFKAREVKLLNFSRKIGREIDKQRPINRVWSAGINHTVDPIDNDEKPLSITNKKDSVKVRKLENIGTPNQTWESQDIKSNIERENDKNIEDYKGKIIEEANGENECGINTNQELAAGVRTDIERNCPSVKHEDRVDAFDYRNFYLHSELGALTRESLQRVSQSMENVKESKHEKSKIETSHKEDVDLKADESEKASECRASVESSWSKLTFSTAVDRAEVELDMEKNKPLRVGCLEKDGYNNDGNLRNRNLQIGVSLAELWDLSHKRSILLSPTESSYSDINSSNAGGTVREEGELSKINGVYDTEESELEDTDKTIKFSHREGLEKLQGVDSVKFAVNGKEKLTCEKGGWAGFTKHVEPMKPKLPDWVKMKGFSMRGRKNCQLSDMDIAKCLMRTSSLTGGECGKLDLNKSPKFSKLHDTEGNDKYESDVELLVSVIGMIRLFAVNLCIKQGAGTSGASIAGNPPPNSITNVSTSSLTGETSSKSFLKNLHYSLTTPSLTTNVSLSSVDSCDSSSRRQLARRILQQTRKLLSREITSSI